jgi:hypothetical protein
MITKQAFIVVEFKERGLLFYAVGFITLPFQEKGLLFYAIRFITLRYQEKGLLFCAKGFTILRFQEKGLLFYVFRRMAYYSTFLDERCLSDHIQPPYSIVSAKEFIAWAKKSELQTT